MTATSTPTILSELVNRLLAIRPLWNLAKGRARNMIIHRAESIGVPWRETVQALRSRNSDQGFSPEWQADLEAVRNLDLSYPEYYTTSFHAYDEGNLGWLPAMEEEVAAKAVHARLWPHAGIQGDAMLRQSYHDVLRSQLPETPRDIVDLGCGVGMSVDPFRDDYPEARVTGVDLSPYFLAVAKYREQVQSGQGAREPGSRSVTNASLSSSLSPAQSFRPSAPPPLGSPASTTWHHALAEDTKLQAASHDLVSAFLLFHEIPQSAAIGVIKEARRLLRPGGHLAIMDMNPRSPVYATMPPFVLTLLKSTEPYLDDYFALDIAQIIAASGFESPTLTCNSPRHRSLIARAI